MFRTGRKCFFLSSVQDCESAGPFTEAPAILGSSPRHHRSGSSISAGSGLRRTILEGRYFEHVVGHRPTLAEYASPDFEVLQFPTPLKIVGNSGDGEAHGGFDKDGPSNALDHVEQYLLPPFRKRMI